MSKDKTLAEKLSTLTVNVRNSDGWIIADIVGKDGTTRELARMLAVPGREAIDLFISAVTAIVRQLVDSAGRKVANVEIVDHDGKPLQ